MIEEQLLRNIATIESYKAFLEYKNLDFDADKHVM